MPKEKIYKVIISLTAEGQKLAGVKFDCSTTDPIEAVQISASIKNQINLSSIVLAAGLAQLATKVVDHDVDSKDGLFEKVLDRANKLYNALGYNLNIDDLIGKNDPS